MCAYLQEGYLYFTPKIIEASMPDVDEQSDYDPITAYNRNPYYYSIPIICYPLFECVFLISIVLYILEVAPAILSAYDPEAARLQWILDNRGTRYHYVISKVRTSESHTHLSSYSLLSHSSLLFAFVFRCCRSRSQLLPRTRVILQ